jgi:integrase
MKVADITTEDIQTFYNDAWERSSPSTANRAFNLYNAIFNKAINLKLYKGQNPCKGIVKQRENPPKEKYFTKEDIKSLLLNAADKLKPLLAYLLLTGCRKSEALNLLNRDMDFYSGLIRITKSKSGKPREIPMSDDLRPILLAIRGNNPQDKVFNITVPALRYSFEKLLKKVGLTEGYSIHTCRHTFASLYMQNSGNITDLSKILGHASLKLTMRYAHFSPQYLKQTIRVMDGIVALPINSTLYIENIPNKD